MMDHVSSPRSSPRLVVIAASAGSLPAIINVLAPLPADFPAAIALVQHRGLELPERLVKILARRTRLRVVQAQDGALLEPGTVYVCPPGVDMTAEHAIRLREGPRLNFVQPNADVMFESVARTYAERAVGIVLSGSLTDGALGSLAIAQAGGTIIAQAAGSCDFSSMPDAARRVGSTEIVLAPSQVAETLQRLFQDIQPPVAAGSEEGAVALPIRTIVIDDHQIVLEGLRALLQAEPDIAVVASAGDGASAIRLSEELSPDVIVMDIHMPGLDGIAATRRILSRPEAPRIVALSAQSDRRSVGGVLAAGASAYVSKQRAFGDLVDAIHAVMAGRTYLSRDVAHLVTSGLVPAPINR
jgi:two-component system, chemotaxis family, protein-glutamate methylesterase/glutaminase